jgi:putative endonuclease
MWVYLIECLDGTIYTGITNNLQRRLYQHTSGFGGANYTKKHGVKKMIYNEFYFTRSQAWRREQEIKTWNHESKVKLALGKLITPVIYRLKLNRRVF